MTETGGILNINKPAGMTSHDVVSAVRRTLGIRKAGHTGTLDPMAEGVLPVCIGKGTRITEYLDLDLKSYRCTLVPGLVTDTLDIWGNVLKEADPGETAALSRKDIEDAFRPFNGVIEQKPPMYSAIRVKGKHLYEYARRLDIADEKAKTLIASK